MENDFEGLDPNRMTELPMHVVDIQVFAHSVVRFSGQIPRQKNGDRPLR